MKVTINCVILNKRHSKFIDITRLLLYTYTYWGLVRRKGVSTLKQYSANNILNLALLGHGGSGKTTLADAFLYYGKVTDRIGSTEDATTFMDFDAEEKKRKVSIGTAVCPIELFDKKINLLDVPGLFDFAGSVSEALCAADNALIVLSGKSGLTVGAEQSYDKAKALNKPTAFFVNKLDSTHSHFYRVMSALVGKYGASICPVVVPLIDHDVTVCFVNLITGKAYSYDGITAKEYPLDAYNDEIQGMHDIFVEAVASVDEELMEKYFSGEAFTEEEIIKALSFGIKNGDIHPVFCGIGASGAAVDLTLEILTKIMPAASESKYRAVKGEDKILLDTDENAPAAAIVFKTIADPFVGKLSYFKVVNGKVTPDAKLINARTGSEERLNKIMWIKGAKQEETKEICAGDIGSVAKLSSVITGDTLCAENAKVVITPPEFAVPNLTLAIYPKAKGDEEKIAAGLTRLMEEDPTVKFAINNETKEQLISGLGEQHLDVLVSKLKTKFGVDVVLKAPRVAYRETIRKSVKVQGRHKKQSGGHGQFGDVWIEFEPCDSDDMIFAENVFGGAVPKNFFPAVETGLRECVKKGTLAGYPVVGLKATLVDGSYHPVDSSEMSFKMAAAAAFKAGIPQAAPVLLEPIGTLNVIVPDDVMGDVIGDINKRRGRVLGMNPVHGRKQEIVAEVPMSEMGDFATVMRSIAQGRAVFEFKFERYEEAPPFVSQKVIAEAQQQ